MVVLGIDASLGSPVANTNLVKGQLTTTDKPTKEIYNPYAYRETEKHIYYKFGKKPLSTPFDKLGNNATLAISYAREWAKNFRFNIHPQHGTQHDLRVIIEVYPALIKSMKNIQLKKELLHLIPPTVPYNSDAYDAALCSIMALLYRGRGKIIKNVYLADPCPNIQSIKQEGWIYYPIVQKH